MSFMHQNFNPKKHTKYTPKNKDKYIGKDYPICRSGLEEAICKILDEDKKVIGWSSESFYINYSFQGKIKRYYPDFFCHIKSPFGEEKWVIEAKPDIQTRPPKKGKNKSRKTQLNEKITWEKNSAKWKSAKNYCEKLGYKFKIITEKQVFKK